MSANYLELIKQVAQYLYKISELSILDLFLFGFSKNNIIYVNSNINN